MPRIDLPGGEWADLLAPSELRSGDMKAIRRQQPMAVTMTTIGDLDTTRDALLRRIITAWSLDLPLPSQLPGSDDEAGSLDRMPIPAYRALVSATDPYFDLINGEAAADPKPSSESDGTSKDNPSSSETTS